MSALTDLIGRVNQQVQFFSVDPSAVSLVSLKVRENGEHNTAAVIQLAVENPNFRRRVVYNRLDLKEASAVQVITAPSLVLEDIIDAIREQTELPLTVDTLTIHTATDGSGVIRCTENNPAYLGSLPVNVNSEEQ